MIRTDGYAWATGVLTLQTRGPIKADSEGDRLLLASHQSVEIFNWQACAELSAGICGIWGRIEFGINGVVFEQRLKSRQRRSELPRGGGLDLKE